jgi:acetyltransferase
MNEVTERSWEGVSICMGVGNEVDLGFAESLAYLGDHEGTRAVVVYAEGMRDPRAFLTTAATVARTKPVIAIKAGRTREGASAALSHTGAVAGPYDRFRAGLAQAGVVEVVRTDELLHVAETLGNQPATPSGTGIVLLSDGGGQGTLGADSLIEQGATLAELSTVTRDELRSLLGPAAATGNPVDLAGAADADPRVFGQALEILAKDPATGSVLVVGLFGGYAVRFSETLLDHECDAARHIARVGRETGTGIVVHSMYAAHRTEPLALLGQAGVPVVGSLDVACRCVLELQRRGLFLAQETPWQPAAPRTFGASESRLAPIAAARADDRVTLTEPESRMLLEDAGLVFPATRVAESADEAAALAAALGVPVVLKLVSEVIIHKSDAGGVRLDLRDESDVRDAYARIVSDAADPPGGRVLVTPMLSPPRAELLVGACIDEQLGPVLTLGAGGIWVEVLADVSHRLLPIDRVTDMLQELRVAAVLAGGRSLPPVDLEAIAIAGQAVARCILDHPDIAEIEVNPLYVYEDRCVPVDARVVLRGV